MTKIFGANWWTTLWGFITVAAAAIVAEPGIISFLPDSWEPTVKGIALFIGVIAGGTFAAAVKSKNVTGGTVQQTADGAVASPTAVGGPSKSVVDTLVAKPEDKP